ncbi:MAG: PEP-CTERM sorting domain-containing protein [Planctomycetota bacterium]|jgi:hypothetical protein
MNVRLLFVLAVALACFGMLAPIADAAPVSIMRGDHPVDTAVHSPAGTVGLDGRGWTTTVHTDDAGGWAAALAGGAPIVVEQRGADFAGLGAVSAWVGAGNRLVILGDFGGLSNTNLLNGLVGGAMTFDAAGADFEPFAKTAAAAGTTFADDAATLFGLSSHHEITSALAPGGTTYYSGAGDPIVARWSVGAGDVFYVGWDFCCGGTAAQANDWYGVLESSLTFSAVPEPGMLSMLLAAFAFGGFVYRRRRTS